MYKMPNFGILSLFPYFLNSWSTSKMTLEETNTQIMGVSVFIFFFLLYILFFHELLHLNQRF